MARPRLLDSKLVDHAKGAAAQATTIEELRCAQAVLLPALASSPDTLRGITAWPWKKRLNLQAH